MELRPGYKKTEIGVIPEDWEVRNLGSLIDPERGIRYGIVQPGRYDPDGRLLIRGQDYSSGWVDSSMMFRVGPVVEGRYRNARVKAGDLIITIVGASTGEVATVPHWLDGANLTQTTARIAIDQKKIHPGFVFYVLRGSTGANNVAAFVKGGAQPGLNCGDVEKFIVPFPVFESEQEAIAEALSDVDASIAAQSRLIAKKRDLRQGAMQRLLTGQTRLPGFTAPWQEKRLGELAIVRSRKVIGSALPKGTPCVELDQIASGSGQLIATGTASSTSVKSRFEVGDVLFGRLRAYLRKFWLADRSGVCSTEIWPLVPLEGEATSGFVFYTIQRSGFIDAASQSYGTHMPRSDWGVVKNFEFLTPSPEEQAAIARVLSDMDAEIAALDAVFEKTRALKQAMMQALLTGRVRLPVRRDAAPQTREAAHV